MCKWILLLLSLAVWAMPETRPVCLLDARRAGFCVRGTDVRGRDQVLLCEILCIHDVGSSTLSLLCGVGLCLSPGEDLSAWHLVPTSSSPAFCGHGQFFAVQRRWVVKVHVMVSLSVPRSEMEVAGVLCCCQSWVFPPYVHPLLPASPSHFQQPGWVTVSPRQRKDVSIHVKYFSKQMALFRVWEKQKKPLSAACWHLLIFLQKATSAIRYSFVSRKHRYKLFCQASTQGKYW